MVNKREQLTVWFNQSFWNHDGYCYFTLHGDFLLFLGSSCYHLSFGGSSHSAASTMERSHDRLPVPQEWQLPPSKLGRRKKPRLTRGGAQQSTSNGRCQQLWSFGGLGSFKLASVAVRFCLVSWLIPWLCACVGWVGRLVARIRDGWLAGWLAGWLVSGSVGWLVCWMVRLFFG